MTPPIHLTLLALAELAPAARWWKLSDEVSQVQDRLACTWADSMECDDWGRELHGIVSRTRIRLRTDHRPTCPACLVMLDWALENS